MDEAEYPPSNEHPPHNWLDYRLCALCGVLRPPALLEDGNCIDKARCASFGSARALSMKVDDGETP